MQEVIVKTSSADGGHATTGTTTDQPADHSRAADDWSMVSLLKGILANSAMPATQPVTGSVAVTNLPSDQLIHGPVSVSNLPAVQPVSGSVAVTNLPATQPVSGAVSVSNFPAPVADQLVHGTVNVSNLPATQPVSGSVAVTNFPAPPADQLIHGPVSVSNFPAVQPISGSVTVLNFPAVQATREVINTGRAQLCLTWENLAGTTAETLATFTNGSHAGSALSSSSSYTVPAGKTLRIQALVFTFGQSGSSACNYRARLRQGAPVGAGSPIIAGTGAGGPANSGSEVSVPIPDGLEIPAGQQIGLTHIDTATGGIWSACLIGFEY